MSQSDFYWLQRSIVANIWIFAPKMAASKMWFYQSICSSFGFDLRYEPRICIENSALYIASKWLHSFLVDPVVCIILLYAVFLFSHLLLDILIDSYLHFLPIFVFKTRLVLGSDNEWSTSNLQRSLFSNSFCLHSDLSLSYLRRFYFLGVRLYFVDFLELRTQLCSTLKQYT